MSFIGKLQRAREVLEQQRRLSVRALGRELGLAGDELEEIVEELIDVQQVASREGAVLRWVGTQTGEEGTAPVPGTGSTPTLSGARKVVTVVFADLAGSTALHERIDPESARRLMESYYATLRAAVEGHGGTVVKLLGDGVLAAFGVPQVAEDDAMRAVHAGVAMQDAFGALVAGQSTVLGAVGLRIAINTGEVVVSGANDDVVGDPVNVAARLQQEARDGDVVLGEATRRLVDALITLEPLGAFALRGRAEAVKAYRVVSLEPAAQATTAAFVGRVQELARIRAVYERAVATPAAHLAVLLGSPGLGKSRLIGEFARRTGATATVVAARCDAAGGATFAPVADGVRELLAIEAGASPTTMRTTVEDAVPADDAERARIAVGIVGLLAGTPGSPEETFFVVRRFLAGLAKTRPVVLVIDDLQWAEPLLLDLVEHLVQWGRGLPLLVLIGARPELREVRSTLATPGALVSDVLALDGLDAGAAMQLAAGVIGAADLPAAVAAKVLATSEGNPLFIAELVRMLVDEGALTRDGDRWTTGATLATVEMPPTIHALLAARIERLAPAQRTALERAAVVGRHFSRSAVAALLADAGADLDARLEALQRAELIERDTGWFLGEPALRFHHVLIRDAAYRRLLKGTRAELHERLASWIEARIGDSPEHDETIGRHLEEAHRLLGDLGPIDGAGQRLGERAATRLAAAGRRALEGDDVSLAAGLLGRALDRLTADDPARADLALDWCEALLAAGDVTGSAAAIDELGLLVDDSDRLRAWHTCFTGHHTVLTAPQELSATVERVAAATTSLASLDDAAGEAKGHFVQALALARLGKVGPCEASLDQALAAARRAGDRRRANTVLAIAPIAALWGPSPVTRASGRCLDVVRVLRITQGAPAVEAVALSCQGVLEALRGRTDAAHRMIESGRQMVEELGIAQRLFETDAFAGFVAMLEGDAPKAERILRGAYDGLRDLGLGIDAARAAALLARAVLAQDRGEEAERLSHESETLAGDDLKAAIAWRGVRAEALAKRGEHALAIELAQAAVAIAAATDALLDHADARLALAAALRAAGRGAEADAEDRRAVELWEAKGATLLAERTQRAASRVVAPSVSPPVTVPGRHATAAGSRRPVRPNFAVVEAQRVEAAIAARDVQALADVYRPDVQIVDHMHGLEYGYGEIVERVRAQVDESTDGAFRHETLATLGDFVALFRMDATASASVMHGIPLGETLVAYLLVIEADEHGCARRIDIFREDALGDAVVRLYERHAELLPEGAARARAAATARSFAIVGALRADFDRWATALSPEIEYRDHRKLGTGAGRGPQKLLYGLRAFSNLTTDLAHVFQDVLVTSPDATLFRSAFRGLDRATGGEFELPFLTVTLVDDAGRVGLWEWFDIDHEAEALARFDELTPGAPAPAPVQRGLRPNAATKVVLGIEAGFAARDASAIAALLADPMHTVEHPTGVEYGREGQIESIARMLRLPNLEFRMELLATLGDTLCLARRRVAASGTAGGRFDVAEFEMDHIGLQEVDGDGRLCRLEVFGADRLGDAIARLYERYAELLPAGPERDRAVAAAATRASVDGRFATEDPRGFVALLAPDFEGVDHRQLGSWSMRGADAYLKHLLALHDVGEEMTFRPLDVLALEPQATLCSTMHSGTDRRGGGTYERSFLVIWMTGTDGRFVRAEWFDDGCEAEALARFDELTAESSDRHPGQPPSRRAVRANAATEVLARMERAAAARDFVALRAALDDDYSELDHPTGSSFGADEAVASVERLFRSRDPYFRYDAVATLGRSLYLGWRRAGASGATGRRFDVGEYENAALQLYEADERGLMRGSEAFAVDRLGESIMRLYELYAAQQSEGSARTRAAAIARTIAAFDGPIDLDRVAPVYDPASRNVDHRVFGTWTTSNAAELLEHYRHQLELAPDFAARFEDVLALGPDSLLARMSFFGTGRDSGGAFENRLLVLFSFGADGRLTNTETFEPEQAPEALARFDAVEAPGAAAEGDRVGAEHSPTRVWNRADAFRDRIIGAWHARDWSTMEGLLHEGFRFSDRRPLILLDLGRDGWIDMSRRFGNMDSSLLSAETIATRGERLVLWRVRIEVAEGDVGPSVAEHLNLFETDEAGDRLVWGVRFEATDVATAFAELDARYEVEQGDRLPASWTVLRRWTRAVADRDWEAVASLCADDFVEHDHRSLSLLGVTQGVEPWMQVLRAVSDLAPDSRFRINHFIPGARGYYEEGGFCGTREGGPFEIVLNALVEISDDGLLARVDIYDDDRVFESPRWAELGIPVPSTAPEPAGLAAPGAAAPRPNAAHAAMRRWAATFDHAAATGDWGPMRAVCAPHCVFDDRRRLALLSGGLDLMVASARERLAVGARPSLGLRGTAGDRIAIHRVLWSGGPPDGPFEIEYLGLWEVDEAGQIVTMMLFDADEAPAVQREAWKRWAAIEPEIGATVAVVSGLADAFNTHDRGRARALCDDALVYHDRRRTGVGRIDGADAAIASIEAYWKLAGDQQLELGWHWPAYGRRGGVTVVRRFGTLPDGGAFESEYLELFGVWDGRATHLELFELEDLAGALARFTELTAEASGDPLAGVAARPNAAVDRWLATYRTGFETGNWEPMREVCAPGFAYADRRRMALVEGDVELLLASVRERAAAGALVELTPVGSAGDRVDVQRVLWSGGPADGRFEIEYVAVTELDASGLITAFVLFDLDDARAAQREAWARWAAIEPHVAAVVAPVGDVMDAFNEKNAAKWRGAFADDLIVEDHRLAGMGRIEGADAYTESVVALWKLAPVTHGEMGWRWPALGRHGAITVVHRTATVPDGGGEFESEYLYLYLARQGHITRIETFEMNALEKALARFEELRPDPLRIPPNAAMRAVARWTEAMLSGDADAVRELLEESYTLDDRRRLVRTKSDRDAEIGVHLPWIHEGGWHATTTVLATAGDRLVLQSWLWIKGEGDARSEIEFMEIDELGDSGRFVRSVIFDPEDRAAAGRALLECYIALGADGMAHGSFETMRGWNAHDLTRVRRGLTDDFVVEDHRLAGLGRLEGADAYLDSVTALFELIPDAQTEFVYHVAFESYGRVSVNRTWGSNTEGGEVESFFVLVSLYRDGKISKFELFEVEHLDTAVRRFEELRPEGTP